MTQFFEECESRDATLLAIRTDLRDTLKVATAPATAPASSTSTGQLHKGGPDTGVFLQLTADDGGSSRSRTAPLASARSSRPSPGDFQSLASRNHRVLGLHLGSIDQGLAMLHALIQEAIVL